MLPKTEAAIKNELVGVFNSVFSYRKFRDSSLTYFPVFVALYIYLKINENIDQMHENTFFSNLFLKMTLMTS